jgi:diguanylate cyclase (GGDEF)-like protein
MRFRRTRLAAANTGREPTYASGSGSMADALGRLPLFAGLRRHELERLARGAEDMEVKTGRVLCREGDVGRQFFVIVEGEVELSRDGRQVRRLGHGAFFGETALIEREPYTTSAIAVTDVRFIVLSSQAFSSLIHGNPVVETRVLRELVVENVAQRNVAEASFREQLELNAHAALHDGLTGLPNRTLFGDRLQQAILRVGREPGQPTVLLMDLDRFKEVNDTLGHAAGDSVLRDFAARLQAAVRKGDTMARLGGDEFAVIVTARQSDDVLSVIQRIQAAAERPFNVQGLPIGLEVSIGVAHYPEHGSDPETLTRHADIAMYAAKVARAGYAFYDAATSQADTGKLTIVTELRRAIENDELVLHYQPKADLETGQVASVEALVRWEHPERGLIPPDEFIPLAQQTTLVKPLTMWVLNEALRQCRAWEDDGLVLSVAVNLSPRNLSDQQLPADLALLLKKWRLAPSRVELEITETAILSDPFRAKTVLDRLGAMGVRLSIDDFGTGYSSLDYLKRLPVNEIKIDRSFVTRMLESEDDRIIVGSTIELARNLGLDVVAEGVEDEETWARLKALRCDTAQGYLLSRPLPAAELTSRLRELLGDSGPTSSADVA